MLCLFLMSVYCFKIGFVSFVWLKMIVINCVFFYLLIYECDRVGIEKLFWNICKYNFDG